MNNYRALSVLLLVTLILSWNAARAQEAGPTAEVGEVAEGVYSIFLMGYNSLVVIGNEGVAITDTASSQRAELLKLEIANITDRPVTHIVLTHEHYDHVGGTGVFPDADVYCHANCVDVFSLDIMGKVPSGELQTFTDFKQIDLGQKFLELHYFGPSDGIANTVIYLPESRVVFTADLYDGPEFLLPEWIPLDGVNLLGVREVLNRISEMDIEYALDAHSSLTDATQLKSYAAFIEDIYDVTLPWVQSTAENGGAMMLLQSTDEFSKSVDLPQYKDWTNYDSLYVYVQRMIASIFHGGY